MKHDPNPESEPDPDAADAEPDANFDPLADPAEQLAEKPVAQKPNMYLTEPPPENPVPATPRKRKARIPSPYILQEDSRTASEIKKSKVEDLFLDRPEGPFTDTEDVKQFIKEQGLHGHKLRIIAVKYQGTPMVEEVKKTVTRF